MVHRVEPPRPLRATWFAVLALGCGGALPPPDFGVDAPDASNTPCNYRIYADSAVALAAESRSPADPDLDPDLRLLDALRSSRARLRDLRELDRTRVACGVRVPSGRDRGAT